MSLDKLSIKEEQDILRNLIDKAFLIDYESE
jgi:hypothetical protein